MLGIIILHSFIETLIKIPEQCQERILLLFHTHTHTQTQYFPMPQHLSVL